MDSDWLLAIATMILSYTALGVAASLYIRLGKLESALRAGRERSEAQLREWRERFDAQHEGVLKEIRRITDARLPHSHEPDGSIIFRVPLLTGSAATE